MSRILISCTYYGSAVESGRLRHSVCADCGRGCVEAGPELAVSKVRMGLASRGLAGGKLGEGSYHGSTGQRLEEED